MSRSTSPVLVLADELKQDNRVLLRTLAKVNRGAKNADPAAFKQALADFEKNLVPHLMKKATRVHSYLRQQSKIWGEFETYEQVTAYKADLTRIGDAVLRFAQVQQETPVDQLDFEKIRTILNTFGHLLSECLGREERELHPLLALYS